MQEHALANVLRAELAVIVAMAVAVAAAMHGPTLSNASDRQVLSVALPKVTLHALSERGAALRAGKPRPEASALRS